MYGGEEQHGTYATNPQEDVRQGVKEKFAEVFITIVIVVIGKFY